jgi:hypothetical protein
MKIEDLIDKIENLKTREDKINFIKEVESQVNSKQKENLHKLKSTLFIVANTHISGDHRNPEFIKMNELIKLAGNTLIELDIQDASTEREING